jgi:fructose-bisphosphate aldolase class II
MLGKFPAPSDSGGGMETYPHLPIAMHQDHGNSPATCYSAIRHGFTSVMMDGSLEADAKTPASYEYNVEVTRKVVEVAHAVGVSVEGELGCLGSLETGQVKRKTVTVLKVLSPMTNY